MTLFRFSVPQWRTNSPIGSQIWQYAVDRRILSQSAHICGFPDEKPKIANLLRLFAPIFAKFAGFMCSYSPIFVYNLVRFSSWIRESGKNRARVIPPEILGPIASKLRVGSQTSNNCQQKMVRTFSIHMPSLVEIGLRTATRDRK